LGENFFLSPVGHSFALKKWDVLIALLPVLWPKFRPLATLFAQFGKASFHLPLLHSTPKERICSTELHLVLVVFVIMCMSMKFFDCFKSCYADEFSLRCFDLSPGLGLHPSIQSHFPLCNATQITDCYWSEESFLSLIGFSLEIQESSKVLLLFTGMGWELPGLKEFGLRRLFPR
jgi:hypothetical protein